ncbi:MAG: SAM-dependent methyltransferase [Lachnospiraceae bacterium]|nr:SAM-dependent methyltransferase [Lachnospiraceae bacterium]
MILSKRLATIVSFVPPAECVADVGTDHGYVPIYLIENGIASRAVAMDVRSGPLKRAAGHVRRQGLQERIDLRLSDGLDGLKPGEADTVIISGLGGPLMIEILKRGRRVAETIRHFVLSPQSGIPGVRVFLRENGYRIDKEAFVKDEGKYYTVMLAVHGKSEAADDVEDRFGGWLLRQGDPLLREYLNREAARLHKLLNELADSPKEKTLRRCEQVKQELAQVERALEKMEG